MNLELISFKLCPFVQRSVITLLYKQVSFKTTFINLAEPPDWFREISPLGKVPLLKVDGEVVFESAVINEFIDEITPDRLMPVDPLVRARHRAWIEMGSSLLGTLFKGLSSKDEAGLEAAKVELAKLLSHVEKILDEQGPYFAGEKLSLVDTAYAPFFQRLRFLEQFYPLAELDSLPKISNWANALLALPAVRDSLPEDFGTLYPMALKQMGGHYAHYVD